MLKNLKLVLLFVFISALSHAVAAQARFKINVDAQFAKEPVSGRLLIFMTSNPKPLEMIEPDFTNPTAVFISGTEITNLKAGNQIEIDADELSFPQKFSNAPAGEYQVMALLDLNHSYTYDGAGAGDLYSKVVK